MSQWSSTYIISKANKFLDSLELNGNDEEMRAKLIDAIDILAKLKAEMLFHGFNVPFVSLLAQSRSELGLSWEESRDLSKQLEAIRNLAASKKFTLNRVRVAMAACRMALEALEYRDSEFVHALPIKGDYLARLVSNTNLLYPYYSIMEVLERECGKRSKIIFTVEYRRLGKPATAKVSISEGQNIMEYVKRVYGEDAKISHSKISNVPELLIKKRSARICLAIAYAYLAYGPALQEAETAANSKKLLEYESFMRSHGLNSSARLDLAEGYDEVKQELVKTGLAKMKEDSLELDQELSHSLALKRKILRNSSTAIAKRLFALNIFRHFILKSKRSRDCSAMLPGLNFDRLALLSDLFSQLKEPPFLLSEPEELIKRKLEAELLQPRLDSRLFGSAFMFLTTDKSIDWCQEYLGVNRDQIIKASGLIAGLVDAQENKLAEIGLPRKNKRAVEFSELIKRKNPKNSGVGNARNKNKKRFKKR